MKTDSITVIERHPLAYEENQRVYTLDELREMFGNVTGNVVVPLLDIILALRDTVRVLGEECKASREHLVSAPHPDTDAPPTCPYFELNTLATQADDCNIADARAAVNANPGARAAVENAQ